MAEKKFLSWIGFKDEANTPSHQQITPIDAPQRSGAAPRSSGTFERIRELEAELTDLRARRDITSLTSEEFEILATETATSLIKTAQAREAKAVAVAQRALSEGERVVKQLTETAETKARTVLQSAEGRGRKYLEAAELEAKEAIARATKSAEDLIHSKQREATTITSAAKREAERVLSEATTDIANFKNWLVGAVEESEHLQKVQHQALAAAEEGIRQARTRLTSSVERLANLGSVIEGALDENHRPKEREFVRAVPAALEKTPKAKKPTVRKSAKRAAPARKSVGRETKRK
jgi:cell division septum initiation protein DivIVA